MFKELFVFNFFNKKHRLKRPLKTFLMSAFNDAFNDASNNESQTVCKLLHVRV